MHPGRRCYEDVISCKVTGEGFCQADNPAAIHVGKDEILSRLFDRHRRDVDDPSKLLGFHDRDCLRKYPDDGQEQLGMGTLPILLPDLKERSGLWASGVVDQDVDELLFNL